MTSRRRRARRARRWSVTGSSPASGSTAASRTSPMARTPERLSDVERVYHAARSQDPSARAAFLADVCAGNEALRQEVESLLASEAAAAGFMSAPAFASGMLGPSASFVGRQLGPYVIQSPLGAGGMGEVYRAHDSKL